MTVSRKAGSVKAATFRALADDASSGEPGRQHREDQPAIAPWRSHLAMALVQLDDWGSAHQLAAEELELAKAAGTAGPIGQALMTLGIVTRDLEPLHEAVDVLEGSPRRLTLIRALLEFGAELRRSRQRRDARPHLEKEPLTSPTTAAQKRWPTAPATSCTPPVPNPAETPPSASTR